MANDNVTDLHSLHALFSRFFKVVLGDPVKRVTAERNRAFKDLLGGFFKGDPDMLFSRFAHSDPYWVKWNEKSSVLHFPLSFGPQHNRIIVYPDGQRKAASILLKGEQYPGQPGHYQVVALHVKSNQKFNRILDVDWLKMRALFEFGAFLKNKNVRMAVEADAGGVRDVVHRARFQQSAEQRWGLNPVTRVNWADPAAMNERLSRVVHERSRAIATELERLDQAGAHVGLGPDEMKRFRGRLEREHKAIEELAEKAGRGAFSPDDLIERERRIGGPEGRIGGPNQQGDHRLKFAERRVAAAWDEQNRILDKFDANPDKARLEILNAEHAEAVDRFVREMRDYEKLQAETAEDAYANIRKMFFEGDTRFRLAVSWPEQGIH